MKADYPIKLLCAVLTVSRPSYAEAFGFEISRST